MKTVVSGVLLIALAVVSVPISVEANNHSVDSAHLEQVITEQTYGSAEMLKAKKAFIGWPAKWYVNDDGVLVMPGDRVVPDRAPQKFLKAKKAFDEGLDIDFVMPGDNVSDRDGEYEENNPDLAL